METNTPCSCGSTETYVNEALYLVCLSCDTVLRPATDDEVAAWTAYLDEQDDRDEPNDDILERQELEDFEGREFYEDAGDPYDCEFDRGGEDYSHEGCCDE